MNPEQEDFEALRRLLALKRYEQPPPRYFKGFSAQVIARLEAGERGQENFFERLFLAAPWLQTFWTSLESRPVLTGAMGAAVCAVLVWGTASSDGSLPVAATEPSLGYFTSQTHPSALAPMPSHPVGLQLSSTNGLTAQPARSFFEDVWPKAQLANFPVSGN